MATRKSYIDYVGTGSQTLFPIDFPYISKSHVYATVNGTAVTVGFASIGVVQITPAPASGAAVHIYRSTPADQLAVFPAGSLIRGADLTTGLAQSVYIAQEALDIASDTVDAASSASSALASKTSAAASASSAAASATAAATFNPANFYTKTEGDGRYGQISGNNSWSGDNYITSNFLYFNRPPGELRGAVFQSSGVTRHIFGVTGTAESGSDAGSNLYFQHYSDSGAALGYSAQVNRATQVWNFYQTPTLVSAPAASANNNQVPTTAWVQNELSSIKDAGNGGVGTIMRMGATTAVTPGSTVAGSALRYCYETTTGGVASGAAASGTWRNIGGVTTVSGNFYTYQRIS